MSTSFVYHAFQARSYLHVRTAYVGGAIFCHLTKKPHLRRCACCRSKNVTLEGHRKVTLRSLPIGSRPTYLVLKLHFLRCLKCGEVRQETRDVAEPRKSYTKAFKRYVLDLARRMTLLDVSRHLNVGWDLIKELVKDDLKRRSKRRSWRKVRRIAIDEIAIKKGRRYMTVVLDLDTGRVLYTAPGNDHTCLKAFFERLRRARASLRAIAVDMSLAYAKAIREYGPPGVTVVFDKYHVVALMNRVLEKVRRAEQNRLSGQDLKVLKGSRFLLLYGIENLAQKDLTQPTIIPRLERLDALLEANQTLYEVYLLKEELRWFWSLPNKDHAERFINQWIAEARQVNQPDFSSFVNTIEKSRAQILAFYDEQITTGPLEGLNNTIKVLKRVAYGYRDIDFFQLRVLFIHEVGAKFTGV